MTKPILYKAEIALEYFLQLTPRFWPNGVLFRLLGILSIGIGD